jgi:hypothetical protein
VSARLLLVVALMFSAWVESARAEVSLPAGAIFATTGSECPEGFTEYTAGAGRILVGAGTLSGHTYTVGGTGGAAFHTLTTSHMPAHSHGLTGNRGPQGGVVGGASNTAAAAPNNGGGISQTSTEGGGTAFDIRQPFVGVRWCSLDENFTGGGVDPQLVIWGVLAVCFGLGVIAGQQR